MKSNSDIPLIIGDVIRKGVIDSVNLTNGTAVVRIGDVVSPDLPWCECAGHISTWCPPSQGESVIILCMEGDIEGGVILRGLFTTSNPPPATGERLHMKLPDGSSFDYDWNAKVLTLDLKGKLIIKAPDDVEITAKVKITGDVSVTGKVDATGKITSGDDVMAGSISLKAHKHGGVATGVAKTLVSE